MKQLKFLLDATKEKLNRRRCDLSIRTYRINDELSQKNNMKEQKISS